MLGSVLGPNPGRLWTRTLKIIKKITFGGTIFESNLTPKTWLKIYTPKLAGKSYLRLPIMLPKVALKLIKIML